MQVPVFSPPPPFILPAITVARKHWKTPARTDRQRDLSLGPGEPNKESLVSQRRCWTSSLQLPLHAEHCGWICSRLNVFEGNHGPLMFTLQRRQSCTLWTHGIIIKKQRLRSQTERERAGDEEKSWTEREEGVERRFAHWKMFNPVLNE